MAFKVFLLESLSTRRVVSALYLVFTTVKVQMMMHNSTLYLVTTHIAVLKNVFTQLLNMIVHLTKGH